MIRDKLSFDLETTSDWWLSARQIFDGTTLQREMALRVSGGRVAGISIASAAGRDGAPVWRTDRLVSPAYVDLQVNGGGGIMVNTSPTPQGVLAIAAAHARTGTAWILPTVITDRPEVMREAADAVLHCVGSDGIAGIHIEGPHISLERRGAHKPEFIRPIDENTFGVVARLRDVGVPVMLTLAPECVPPGTVARLARMGVVVSLGHTNADAVATRAAIAEGARAVTHLYNAMTPITSREPGVVGAALDSTIHCGFIADGLHVEKSVLRLAIRSRPRPDRMFVVSDAMPTLNGPDCFSLYGETIRVHDGRLVNARGSLAGAHIDMAQSVHRLATSVGIAPEDALRMATSIPADLMGLGNIGRLAEGNLANLVLLDHELSLVGTVLSDGDRCRHRPASS